MDFQFDNTRPIYVQLVEQLVEHIVSGKLPPGARIPSVRELALQSKVNPNTMQKALAELESMALVRTERTNGKFVTDDAEHIDAHRKALARQKAIAFLRDMRQLGFEAKDAIHYLKTL